MKIFIAGAWPYANGSLHVGHVASLIPADVLARYFRLKGDEVLYVSGSDCHGTPITVKAKQECKAPEKIAEFYHKEFKKCFEDLGFTYDVYSKTYSNFHYKEVKRIFLKLLKNDCLYEKEIDQTYCQKCEQFLPDRYIEGNCPSCGNVVNGDQCEKCFQIFETIELRNKSCKICKNEPIVKKTRHFYFKLSKFQNSIEKYFEEKSHEWKENAINLTKRYLDEGLEDRAVTRDLDYGIDTPVEGFENKKIYVWIEAVCGYYTASKKWALEYGKKWEDFWINDSNNIKAYYVHGKDNIPFHTVILPSILLGLNENLHLPDMIISSEFLNLEGRKISTSKNWAVWLPYLLKNYNADTIRYFLLNNGPEKGDADFSWREFVYSNNIDLLGGFGNFVNRIMPFIEKYKDSFKNLEIDSDMKNKIEQLYTSVGEKIENGKFKESIKLIFGLVRSANKYFDD
ncbi:MAG: methionine--tRNA ligase, partial [Firmicutes bacterium]|nr:methionine--tRNA ligase [Bacillota bacterium]